MRSSMGVQSALGAGAGGTVGPWIYGRWAGVPQQRRSRRTFYKFLDAAEALLANRQWHEVSVQDIVRSAEASVGAFYNRFPDKAALLHCLDDRLAEECERTVDSLLEELEGGPELAALAPGIMVSLFMRLCADHGGVIRALDLAAKMTSPSGVSQGETGAPQAGLFGLGARFDGALGRFSAFLSLKVPAYQGRTPEDILAAFQETFWLTRERLSYRARDAERLGAPGASGASGASGADDANLHSLLMRHFSVSLQR